MRYAVVDFETSNARLSSICQIGVAVFRNRQMVDQQSWLVNPRDHFDAMNVSIHGISESHVLSAPSFEAIWPMVEATVTDLPIVHHTHFDKSAARQACEKHGLPISFDRWLDSARIVRRVWPEYANGGYGLGNLAEAFGISFDHHDAAADAFAAGEVLARALNASNTVVDDWLGILNAPRSTSAYRAALSVTSVADGPLSGETCVFTGSLALGKAEAAKLAAALGANVAPGVNRQTTLVVVGDQDISRLAGHSKSSKHRKAEALAADGLAIRIISEGDFLAISADAQR